MQKTSAPLSQQVSSAQETPEINQRTKKYNKPHMIIPDEDMAWALEQRPPVYKLWGECWRSDPYGSRWMPLLTSLGKENFKKAKRPLIDSGLFMFENRLSVVDGQRSYEWWVKNLHGCRSSYWFKGVTGNDDTSAEKNKYVSNGDQCLEGIKVINTTCVHSSQVETVLIANQELSVVNNSFELFPKQKKTRSQETLVWNGNCLICEALISTFGKIPRSLRTHFKNSLKPDAYKITARVKVSDVHKVLQSVCAAPLGSYKFLCNQCIDSLEEQRKIAEAEATRKALLQQYNYNYQMVVGIIKCHSKEKLDFYLRYAISDKMAQKLAAMSYHDFLQTEYWQLVRKAALHNADYRCEMCNSSKNLQVHHRSYEHRGYEFRHLEDLTVVCRSCHAFHHRKEV
ncbi:MAG: hypothetical protein SAK29_30175 [Scytonema sp. PMC 1069.18]|nr:hypothetical protein [Scytonema sp. PMC 1069.18]MEC4887500.1 hypothetical protein [Scytonema sp. PMC 1070.18]